MEKYEDNRKFTFIPKEIVSFSSIQTNKLLLKNDVFEKYEASVEVIGEYIICNDINKIKKYSTKIKKESYEQYIEFIKSRDMENDRWIYNIIDGISEQDKVLFRDDLCIVIPTYTWNSRNVDKLRILCLPIDKQLRTIRELTQDHIPLLEHMKKVTLQIVENIYGLTESELKMFFHYHPSTYHLHIHFINTKYNDSSSSVEYSHDLDSVIFNLSLDTNYYKKIVLNRRD